MSQILIIDDDEKIRTLLKDYFSKNGLESNLAASASQAKQMISSQDYQLLIIDVMMPGQDGISLTKELKSRADFNIPIILLTAVVDGKSRVKGLEYGADDYLAKPFEPRELLLRSQRLIESYKRSSDLSVLKGSEELSLLDNSDFNFGGFTYNLANKKLINKNGEEIYLASNELDLLDLLVKNYNQEVLRSDLSEYFNNISERSIDVQITRLRRKIEPNPKQPQYIKTIRGRGYMLVK
jgi:two-component system phosphate regulon response regulator OmpR